MVCMLPCVQYGTPFPSGKWWHALVPDVTNCRNAEVSLCPIMAQILSVSYRADFGHRIKASLVTANSPGTIKTPQFWVEPNSNEGRTRSSGSSTNRDISHIGAQTIWVWLFLRTGRYPVTRRLSRYARTYLTSDTGRHRFRIVDNGSEVDQIQAILQANTRHWVQSITTII